ncbi:flagellar hook-basal body complex protein FliE [Profundibacterium mesophilum]|uniref:Flagellar hook-basal body complex protein FliE n=1 Tax=Profundibacterium mesophilum KAUST100406-0324 TaxID=1037889 RepID=A0A921NSJ0_9RHOB|nr:flagellar hook-basal body complex protein FliE [Profundibacterium mesophilum]KAF0674620.1 putative flagellar hook-basal body complex protein [Profundibacterium mesophilum KAUST100406-0324]
MSEFSTISSSLARGAYRSSQDLAGQTANLPDPARAQGGPSFSDVLKEASASAVETVRAGDAAAVAGLRGDITTQQVVEATMEMETTVKMAVSMRDKFVAAYQEILRMPI